MAVNIHITIIELNALHTKRQNLFQELDAVIHLLMEAKHWGDRKSGSAGMPRPISYAVFCLKKKKGDRETRIYEALGSLAAYAADEYLLGAGPHAEQALQAAARRGDFGTPKAARAYLADLHTFLTDRGYISS